MDDSNGPNPGAKSAIVLDFDRRLKLRADLNLIPF